MSRQITLPLTRNCEQCGKLFAFRHYGVGRKSRYNRKQIFCSRDCADAAQTKGWGTDKSGYQVQYRSDGNRRVWKMQHRVVMEEHLGRKLHRDETVHHKNGNRSDNRLENLELWSTRHCAGQRVEDKIKWCNEFLKEYQPRQADNVLWQVLSSIMEPRVGT